jgi:acetolactate synthase-1/2/3 large subunit
MGKGGMPDDHPLCFGYTRLEAAWKLVKQSDCVIALGVRFTDLSTENWEGAPRGLIHVNVDPAEEGKKFTPEVMVVGDVKAFLLEIVQRLRMRPFRPNKEWRGACGSARKARREKQKLGSAHFLDLNELRQALPGDAIVCSDVCQVGYAMVPDFHVYQPRTFLAPSLFLAMGYGLPAAIGAKAAFPQRPVISVSGNGGFLMTCAELGSAKHNGLPVLSIVINDGIYGTIRRMQNDLYGGRHMAIHLQETDFVKLAGAFDVPGIKVTRSGQLREALEWALKESGPCLIEVCVR